MTEGKTSEPGIMGRVNRQRSFSVIGLAFPEAQRGRSYG